MSKPGRPPFDDVLTPAEWTVAEGVRHGLTNPVIAQRMNVSMDAVKFHVANILGKLGFGSRLELRHWNGIRRHSALFGKGEIMSSHAGIQSIGQIARSVANLEAAEAWYRDVLCLKHLYTFADMCFFACGGVRLYLSEAQQPGPESILYFEVEGIHETCADLAGRGIEFINAPHRVHQHADGTEEWMAFFKDNEGRPLALMARVPPNRASVEVAPAAE